MHFNIQGKNNNNVVNQQNQKMYLSSMMTVGVQVEDHAHQTPAAGVPSSEQHQC